MKQPFHAVDKTAELLDRLVKEQYEAGEAAVAHDLSQLRGIMLPYSMTDRHVSDMWLKQFHKTDEQKEKEAIFQKRRKERGSVFAPQDVVVVSGQKHMADKVAKELLASFDQQKPMAQDGHPFLDRNLHWIKGVQEENMKKELQKFLDQESSLSELVDNQKAKAFAALLDEELNRFLEDKVDTTNVQTFIQSTMDGLKDLGYEVVGVEQTFEDLGGAENVAETTITPVPYLPDAFSPMFPISRVTNDVSGLPNIAYRPFGDLQQLTEQCLKCRGTGLNSLLERCQRCKGSGYAR